MAQGFTSSLDIAKRVAIHLGSTLPATLTDDRKLVTVFNALYDKARRAELRRHVWTFAIRRMVLRAITASQQLISTPPGWSTIVVYNRGAVVSDGNGNWWLSLTSANLNNVLVDGGFWTAYYGQRVYDNWSAIVTYFPGDVVLSGGHTWIAGAISLNQVPPNASYWTQWVDGTLAAAIPGFDLSGFNTIESTLSLPLTTDTRNQFLLPYNYLRLAPQDPKTANNPRLAVSAEMRYRDWEIENSRLMTADPSPLMLRFVMDTTNVAGMDDLFAEALSARIGMEAAEVITQSKEKIDVIAGNYTGFIRMAHEQNAIELGSTEDPENPDALPGPTAVQRPQA